MGRRGRVAAVAGVALALWFAGILASRDWNPSTLVAAGQDDIRVTGHIAEQLGPDFIPQEAWGHDGKFVLLQAQDPLLVDRSAVADLLDAPVYRSQRVLWPALVGLGALFGPWGVVWAFPIMMVALVALGAWATAGLMAQIGRSPWWGLVFVANPGLFYSYRRGTVDVAAVALLVVGVYLASGRRYRGSGAVLAAAVLAKEVMILGAIGLVLHRRQEGLRVAPVLLFPMITGLAWAAYVRVRLGASLWAAGAEVVAVPLSGAMAVVGQWPAADALVALAVLALAVVALLVGWRAPSPSGSAASGFALLLLMLPAAVWGGYVDAWRAAAPVIALLVPGLLAVNRVQHREIELAPV